MDPVDRIERATAYARDKVGNVTAADLSNPTPCSEFDVRALLNHMIGGLGMLATAATGGQAAMPEGDQFGSDPGRAYGDGRDAFVAALGSPGVFDRNWEMPFGSLPGAVMGNIAFMEHLTHGWDVAKATGQDTTMPTDLVSECMEMVVPMDAMLRTPGVCGPPQSVPDDAPVQDKFIAFMGRTPQA